MPVIVNTAASDHKLVTVSRVLEDLPDSAADDYSYIEGLIEEASAVIADHTGRVWAKQEYIETFAGYGKILVALHRAPLVEMADNPSAVTYDGEPITDWTVHDYPSAMLYREVGWEWTRGITYDIEPSPTDEHCRFAATYWAGYDLPNWSTYAASTNKLPPHIERACLLTVVSMYTEERGSTADISFKKVGDLQIGYNKRSAVSPLPLKAQALLARYRPRPW